MILHRGSLLGSCFHQNPEWKNWFLVDGQYPTPSYQLLFAKPGSHEPSPVEGTYQLEVKSLLFEPDANLHPQLVLLGQVYGVAGTDYWRRDLVIPLLWGMPFTLIIGFVGTLVTLLIAMLLPAIGVWFGGWLDNFIQRLTEVNMVVPGLAIAVLAHALYGVHIWIVLGIVVVLNAFGSPIKTFRSALLQAKRSSLYRDGPLVWGERFQDHPPLSCAAHSAGIDSATGDAGAKFYLSRSHARSFQYQIELSIVGSDHLRRTDTRRLIWFAFLGAGANLPALAHGFCVCLAGIGAGTDSQSSYYFGYPRYVQQIKEANEESFRKAMHNPTSASELLWPR